MLFAYLLGSVYFSLETNLYTVLYVSELVTNNRSFNIQGANNARMFANTIENGFSNDR